MLNKMKSVFGENKIFTKILLGIFAIFLFSGTAFADTSIRLEQPETQTYKDAFDITFIALDTNPSQAITIQCQKKGPSDADFVNFGSSVTLSNGGNTDICQVNPSIVNQNGFTYQFRVIANGSTSNVLSNSVNVKFNNQTPAPPEGYNKTKLDNCTYKISFRTGNDSNKTTKVVLYRSSETSFTIDSGHKVNAIDIGSDTAGSITDNISPNCNTTYYYAIRAFDAYGNGSDSRGDSNVTTTVVNPTTTEVQGAIPVTTINVGQEKEVLGEEELGAETKGTEEVLGATKSAGPSITPTVVKINTPNWILTHKKISLLALFILACVGVALYRNKIKE
jgi:hypothetical protein